MAAKQSRQRANLIAAMLCSSFVTAVMLLVVFPRGRECDLAGASVPRMKPVMTPDSSGSDSTTSHPLTVVSAQSQANEPAAADSTTPAADATTTKPKKKEKTFLFHGKHEKKPGDGYVKAQYDNAAQQYNIEFAAWDVAHMPPAPDARPTRVLYEPLTLPDDWEAPGNPRYTDVCRKLLTGDATSPYFSQHRQDWFIYNNYYARDKRKEGTGFYVDLGTNDAKIISNSFFFDACLGWKGLCIEPNPRYAKEIKSDRTCELIPHCVWDEDKSLTFWMGGVTSRIVDPAKQKKSKHNKKVQCLPLDKILNDRGIKHIDFFSLDAEEVESTILKAFTYEDFDINVWVVEHNEGHGSTNVEEVEELMTTHGYRKVKHPVMEGKPLLILDDVYVSEKAENAGLIPKMADEDILMPPNSFMSTYFYNKRKGKTYGVYKTNCHWPC